MNLKKLDLAAIALVLALAISLLLSARAPQEGQQPDSESAVRRGALGGSRDVAAGPLVNPASLPTPSPNDVEMAEDDPQRFDDGSFRVSGRVANRNASFTLEITAAPRVEVLDVDQQTVSAGEAVLEASLVHPGGSVEWSYLALPTTGRPAVSFQHTGLRGRWVLP